ncbi:MAG: leucine-rich repeat domain-containing protein [Candidatus Poribacteria bacterium]|nr:leucine-rich repeat domain-containing protein [Candidatus Poribacteria bacterium]
MPIKPLSITIFSLLFSFLLPSLSQAQPVSIPDPNLAAAIRQEIGNAITTQTLLNLTRLEIPNRGITDLTGLGHARNLSELNLSGEYIEAEQQTVNSNTISDFSPIAGLTRLTWLDLSHCDISDVSFLSGLTQLEQLYLWDNDISDVSHLATLKKLTWLMLEGNTISDVSPLAELTKLDGLGLADNTISDISPLAELKKLTGLSLWGNTISDVSPVAELTKLTWLWLSDNTISDISPIVGLNLTGTEWDSTGLDIRWNPLSYASINTHIPAMQAKGVEIKFENRTPTTLHKISETAQEGIVNMALPVPFVVEVRDEQNSPFAGVPVTFTITAGGGKLSTTRTTTDTTGRATAHLTLGRTAGMTTVRVTAADISQNVQFTATAILRRAPVPIPDPNLRAKITETLGKRLGAALTVADILKLRTLTANRAGIHGLTGLQHASNLTSLSLNNNGISNVAPLAGLVKLTTLNLRDNWISDVSLLTSLAHLQRLDLRGNPLSDTAIQTHIPLLQSAGVNVRFDDRTLTQSGPIVRLIYFRPRDRQPQPDIDAQLDRLIKEVQQFYADEMERHGYGRKTFQFETDAQGNAVVYHVIGKLEDTAYHDESGIVWDEIDGQFDTSRHIYLTALDVSSELIGIDKNDTACGVGDGGNDGGDALIPASGHCFIDSVEALKLEYTTAAHELGHAFGLWHDFRNDAYIMSYGAVTDELAQCTAEWLDVHPYFNTHRAASTAETAIEMLSPSLASAPNAIRLRFKVTDPDGVHQAQLLTETLSGAAAGSQELIACKHLNQTPSNTINFVTTSLIPANKTVSLQVIDVHGNFTTSEAFPVDVASLLPPSKVIRVPDPNLATALRQEIGNSITTHTILNLTRLEAPNRGITDLTGLQHARNLRELNLGGEYIEAEQQTVNSNAISDFSPIAGLTQLTRLELSHSGISDVSFLSNFTKLTELRLGANTISDISPLAKLTQLNQLYLWNNTISDVAPLSELKKLTWLMLDDNIISDVSPLAELTQLTDLYLWDNTISDVSPLAKLKKLNSLDMGNNTISDISDLAELTRLTELRLGSNTISDVSPLAKLTQLTQLNLNNNSISDVSPLVKLNLTGTEWNRTGLDITGNPLSDASINIHIPAMQAKGILVRTEDNQETFVRGPAKIEGPWLWMIGPTGGRTTGANAAASGIDFLSRMSNGTVTELKIATEGATAGAPVGDSVWTLHKLSPTGSDNINDMVKAAGLGTGDIDYHVAYGSIALDSPRQQQTTMHVGSDDAVKVWLNGELVHNNFINRPSNDFQEHFPITLKAGTNILLVAVYEGWGEWSGFFGFAADAEYTVTVTTDVVARPAWDVNEDGITDATDATLVTAALGQKQPDNPRLDVNSDGVVDGKDLALVAEHLGEGDAPAGPSHPALPLGFTLDRVEHTLNLLRIADDETLTFKRGIENLERLLALFVPENTALLHNYPNPFNPETWIPYQLAKPAEVTLRIYAVNGALVRTLALGHQPAGTYRIRSRAAYWDGQNGQGETVASGIYFYTITAGDYTATRKMLIRK